MATNSGGSGSGPESGSGSGSGSSSGSSGETARPKAAQNPPESITFTFSSRNSPFAHLSPPGSVTFVSNKRRGSESSRDRPHRKQQSSQSAHGSGWITLAPLKPVSEVSPPLFDTTSSPSDSHPSNTGTAVFSSRTHSNTRTSPRLSLVAQHYHATSPHPSFNTPPALVTPPPQDPFGQLKRLSHEGYFPLVPLSKSGDSRPKKKSSKSNAQSSRKIEHPQPMHFSPQTSSSRTPTAKLLQSGTSESTPRPLSRFDQEGVAKDSVRIPVPESSATSTPTQLKSRSRKSTPPHLKTPQFTSSPQSPPPKSGSPQPQPSIDAFRDCFGVLTTRVENVFPTRSRHRSRSNSGGSENLNVMGSGPSLSDSQRRWTRRWLRRTLRGVGSMGSGSTSSGSTGTGGSRLRGGSNTRGGSSLANTMIYLGLGGGAEEVKEMRGSAGSGSQDSLDRVRVSRSNAPSPSNSSGCGSSAGAPTRKSGQSKLGDIKEMQAEAPNSVTQQPTKVQS
ncbi:unnamed protein product [Rhizoctonia solani]|uniref:Uncharacterized protein n=1 Tax=Rhizoctonia solani TaxID=456999 RepID=A0A8H3DSU3_9AGAM|nr:unnamed protein product [Rhizoctonia solani]